MRLGRLRWYCQSCVKQCIDENGFKCHCDTPQHIYKMSLFLENSAQILLENSLDFHTEFLAILSTVHASARVNANVVYQELISDPGHTHVNATTYKTLGGYLRFLAKEGHALVEESETSTPFISYIDKSAKAMQRALADGKARNESAQITRQEKMIQERIDANSTREHVVIAPSELVREGGAKIQLEITRKVIEGGFKKKSEVGKFIKSKPNPLASGKSKRIKLE